MILGYVILDTTLKESLPQLTLINAEQVIEKAKKWCDKTDIKFITFKDSVDYLNTYGFPVITVQD